MSERPSSAKRLPTDDERAQRDRFKQSVLIADRGICIVHGEDEECEGPLQAHHVITQQQLRHAHAHHLLWDWHNGATICEGAHTRHTKAVERIPMAVLPLRCKAWASAHGFDWLLDRYYPR